MRIAIFYKDVFRPGGAPLGIRNFARSLARQHQVTILGQAADGPYEELKQIRCLKYRSLFELLRSAPGWLKNERPDVLLVVGYFLYENVLLATLAERSGTIVVLSPLAQVWDKSFEGKIFTNGCDVRELENNLVNRTSLVQRVKTFLSPHVKNAYARTLGRMLVNKSRRIAVLSGVEQYHFNRYYPRPDQDFLYMYWGIDPQNVFPESNLHYYRDVLKREDDRANFVVWSRLDWYYKGLDRLLEGVRVVKERLGADRVPFRLFLCGPDYREGSLKAGRYIEEHGLEDIVTLILPGGYEPGSHGPIRDADASILLSCWDGSPRALRESIYYNTPIMVSPETNFGELVQTYNCGLLVEQPDIPEVVARHLVHLADSDRLRQWRQGTAKLATQMTWSLTAEHFVEQINQEYAKTTQHRKTVNPQSSSLQYSG